MNNPRRTKAQLTEELAQAQARIAELEASGAGQAERSLTQRLLKALLVNATDHLYFKDAESRVVMISESLADTFGLKDPADAVGKSDFDFFSDEHARPAYEDEQGVMQSGQAIAKEEREVWPDGRVTWVSTVKLPLRDESGEIVGTLGISRDITEDKRAEKALREGEARYRAMVEAFDGLIYICSQDYRVEFLNQQLLERTGHDGTGELCYEVLHDRDSVCPWCVNDRVFAGETVRWEIQSPKDNRWYYVVNVPIYHPDGSMSKQAMISDITERKQGEDEQERLQREVIEAQQQAIRELSTPIIPIAAIPGKGSIIVLPLIGVIDSLRAKDITRRLLAGISKHRAKVVILDITGVPIVDTSVAAHLSKAIQAARLKGARTIVTGISDAVAETIVDLGLDWMAIETLSDLQTGLWSALATLGVHPSTMPAGRKAGSPGRRASGLAPKGRGR